MGPEDENNTLTGDTLRRAVKEYQFAANYGAGENSLKRLAAKYVTNPPTWAELEWADSGVATYNGDIVSVDPAEHSVSKELEKRIQRLQATAVEDAKVIRKLKEQCLQSAEERIEALKERDAAVEESKFVDDDRRMLATLREQIQIHEDENRQLLIENNALRAKLREAGIE